MNTVANPGATLPFLERTDWLPPACDPARVMQALAHRDPAGCAGVPRDGGAPIRSNVVERLALGFGLLRQHAESHQAPPSVLETMEMMGYEVSPDFAEQGVHALTVLSVAHDLLRGENVPALQSEMAAQSIGRLWETAFEAPAGIGHYITRSLTGRVPSDYSFFPPAYTRSGLSGQALGEYLVSLVDLLQAAIAVKQLPSSAIGADVDFGDWSEPRGYMDSGRGRMKPASLVVHSHTEPLAGAHVRIRVKLTYGAKNEPVGFAEGVVLQGSSGMYDEFPELAASIGSGIEHIIRGTFSQRDVVTIFPRVRQLLDLSENQVTRLMGVETLYVAPAWRKRGLGRRLLQQLFVESGDVEVVLGAPGVLGEAALDHGELAIAAAVAAAKLSQARYWHTIGADYLINGVMGMALPQVNAAREEGIYDRTPERR